MIPTPAQGSIVLTSVKENDTIAQICHELNHAETEICIDIERAFFKLLNGDNKIIKRIFNLDTNAFKEGHLPVKTKELLGLVASAVLRCDDCIAYHLETCYKEGI